MAGFATVRGMAILEAFNAGDFARMGELAVGSAYVEPATGRRDEGEAYLDGARMWKTAFPDVTGEIVKAYEDGNTAIFEMVWRGTQTGDLVTPNGTVPATGRSILITAVQVIESDGTRLVENRHYLDIFGLMVQLGVVKM